MVSDLLEPLVFDLEAFMATPRSTTLNYPCDTFMYVIKSGEFCKVGIAVDMKRRMDSLRASNPHELELIAKQEFTRRVHALLAERTAHAVLAPYSVGREWFRVEPRLAVNAARVVGAATRKLAKRHDRESAQAYDEWCIAMESVREFNEGRRRSLAPSLEQDE